MRCSTILRYFFKSRLWRHFYHPRSKIIISHTPSSLKLELNLSSLINVKIDSSCNDEWLVNSQKLGGKKCIETSVVLESVIVAFSYKKRWQYTNKKKYCLYVVFYINLKIECEIIAM